MSRRQTYAARTAAPPRYALAVLSGLALAAGCFDPRYGSGNLQCAPGVSATCPGGFFCASDNKCWKLGEGPQADAAVETDAPPVDGAEVPPSLPPVLTQAASASPSPVLGNTTMLSVMADDAQGEGSGLIYHWTVTGPGTVGFSVNSSAAAKETTAIFTKAGHYIFTVLIQNRQNQSVTSTVEVDVHARLNDLEVVPLMATVALNGTQQFTTIARDQFGESLPLNMQPRWQLAGACGMVNENTGLFQAGMVMASGCTLIASVGTINGLGTVSVGTAPPIEVTPIADSYVDDGAPDKNFGGLTVMFVKTQNDTTNNRTAYLKFPLTAVTPPVSTVKFRLFGRAFGGTHNIGVYAVADTTWTELGLNFKNRPALGPRLVNIGVTTAPKYHEWDVTAHLQARVAAGDTTITLAVKMDAPVTVEPDAFDSREATNRPQLVFSR